MKKLYLSLAILATLTLNSFCQPSKIATASETNNSIKFNADSSIIISLIEKYAESINNADTVLGFTIFAHSDEVSFLHPRGHEHGWTDINNHIYKFFGAFFSKRKLTIINKQITVYGDVAWATFYWVFDATFKKDNSPLQTKGRETQIWKKTNHEWRLVHVHYSNMPGIAERTGF